MPGTIEWLLFEGDRHSSIVGDRLPQIAVAMGEREFDSCFLSYSTKDEDFAKHLHSRLRGEHLRVWFAPDNVLGGKKIYEQIEEAIYSYDRLIVVLSEWSMSSEWVKTEIANARRKEMSTGKPTLFPIRLVDFERIKQWKAFDADVGKDSAVRSASSTSRTSQTGKTRALLSRRSAGV